ncbi:MAG: periplasmic heavy metal sensor [Candidatus Omnitrophota bacterium]
MKKMRWIGIGLVALLFTAGTLYAQPSDKEGKACDEPKGRMFKELNLTQEQQSRLEQNRQTQQQEMKRLHEVVKEKHTKLQESLKNPSVTREGVQPLANEIKSLQAQLIDSRINGIFAVKEILTPEQFARFQEMAEKRQEHRKGRFLKWRERTFGKGRSQDTP